MTFIGRLRDHSMVWKRWRGEARVGGLLHGVYFYWEQGNVYRTMPLTADQIGFLQGHGNIVLEAVGTDMPSPDVVMASAARAVAQPAAAPAKPYVNNRLPGRRQ